MGVLACCIAQITLLLLVQQAVALAYSSTRLETHKDVLTAGAWLPETGSVQHAMGSQEGNAHALGRGEVR